MRLEDLRVCRDRRSISQIRSTSTEAVRRRETYVFLLAFGVARENHGLADVELPFVKW